VFPVLVTGLVNNTTYYYQALVSNAYDTASSSITNFTTTPFLKGWYVAANGPAGGDGSSWEMAFTNLQTAIDAAAMGDTIYIAGHTFSNSTAQSTAQGNSQYVWTNKPLTILGGYAADGGTPGALTNIPTILTQTNAGTSRILNISGLTNGSLQRVTLTGGYGSPMTGAGLYIAASSNLTIGSCVVSNNAGYQTGASTEYGGGIYLVGSVVSLTNCVVTKNSVYGYQNNGLPRGGGIYVASGTVTLDACRVDRNQSYKGSCQGGGIYLESGTLTISNSVICHNSTFDPGVATYGRGGGISVGGGALTMENVLLHGNTADTAGSGYGLRVDGGTATVNQCTVASHIGDAIKQTGGAVGITNSILWGNRDDIAGTVALANCDVQDGDSNGVKGCISADPLFRNGFYLGTGSPCVNTGNVTATAAGLGGRTTRIDGTPDSDVVDLGYHYPTGFDLTYADIYVATNGDDSVNGTSALAPLQTIGKALATATDGSRIHIAAGTYATNTETFPLMLDGKIGVQLLGTNRATTILSGNGSSNNVLRMQYASGATRLEGLTLTGGNSVGNYYQKGLTVAVCSDVTLASCLFTNITSYTTTPVISSFLTGGALSLIRSRVGLTDCDVVGNQVSAYAASTYGGGVYMESGILAISNSVIRGNMAGQTSFKRNLYNGCGGAVSIINATLTMRNTLVAGNLNRGGITTGGSGGSDGIYIGSGSASLNNCTLASNINNGIVQVAGTVGVTNSILWDNGIDVTGAVTLAYCDVGVVSGVGVTTNNCLSTDPLFVDRTYYHLQSRAGNYVGGYFSGGSWAKSLSNSLCIDVGDPASDHSQEPAPNGNRVNLGAYGNTPQASMSSTFATLLLFR
jgi:hypothetical protein